MRASVGSRVFEGGDGEGRGAKRRQDGVEGVGDETHPTFSIFP